MNSIEIQKALDPQVGVNAAKVEERVQTWLTKLGEIGPEGYTWTLDKPGRKFRRLVMTSGPRGQRLVHAFYDILTGDVLKAEGWAKPAKHVRYNLLDDTSFAKMMERCDWSGGYLYMDSGL